ncbi:hypothetical protein AB0B28_18355 [Glycomyces sp. NPDC046736]|uniref:hypothetical protein n=1 Tax=Glycomyces sp. NPDC046736 TaxID=3155615 RepID=UPI0033F984E1
MYSWIWKKLPGGLPGKIGGSVALSAGMLLLLWFVVFPAVRPHMPWSNVDPAGEVNIESDQSPSEGETCTPGLDCQNTEFDPEDWQTQQSPGAEDED